MELYLATCKIWYTAILVTFCACLYCNWFMVLVWSICMFERQYLLTSKSVSSLMVVFKACIPLQWHQPQGYYLSDIPMTNAYTAYMENAFCKSHNAPLIYYMIIDGILVSLHLCNLKQTIFHLVLNIVTYSNKYQT